jgi:hypothetical protein
MPHSYKWADAEHTIVSRDDGKTFAWPKGTNVGNINGRVAEEYRLEGSPKPASYKTPEPVAAAKPKQAKPPAIPTVAAAEAVLADLEKRKAALLEQRAADDRALSAISYQAHAHADRESIDKLDEITENILKHDAALRSISAAIEQARSHVAQAQAATLAAANQQRAAELSAHVDELSQVPAYIEKHLTAALNGLTAFERGVAELHQKGVAFPTDIQLRLGMVAVLGTWLQQLPKMWFNEISGGVPFRAPAERKSAISYWTQIEPSLRNAIGQRGKPESEAA